MVIANKAEHLHESCKTVGYIMGISYAIAVVWGGCLLFLYAGTRVGLAEAELFYYQEQVGGNITAFFPATPFGYLNYAYGEDAHRSLAYSQFIFIDMPALMTVVNPLVAVVGFNAAWHMKRVRFWGFFYFSFVAFVSAFIGPIAMVNFAATTLETTGVEAETSLISSLITIAFNLFASIWAPLHLIWVFSDTVFPDKVMFKLNCKRRMSYISNVAGANLVAALIGTIIIRTVVLPAFVSRNTSDFYRYILAIFGTNVILFLVFAFGRVSAFKVERLHGHRGWGVLFVTIQLRFFGRAMLTGLSGSTSQVGTSIKARLPMLGTIIAFEIYRFIQRMLTQHQDRLFLYLCNDKAFRETALVPLDHLDFQGDDDSPSETGASRSTSKSSQKDTLGKMGKSSRSMTSRGDLISGLKRSKSMSSMSSRTGIQSLQAETYMLVCVSETTAAFFAPFNVMLLEIYVIGLTPKIAVGAFFINFLMQTIPQIIFLTIYTVYRSIKSNFTFHVTLDAEIWQIVKLTLWCIFTLTPWITTQVNRLAIDNLVRDGIIFSNNFTNV